MNKYLVIGIRLVVFVLLQVLVLNQIEIGFGIQIMIYPLFTLLLPVEMGVTSVMFLSFVLGIAIDAMSNSYGLHTSAILTFAYLRPMFFKLFSPRDGYDNLLETTIFAMGTSWFVKTFGTLLLVHHFWFFMLEMFKINELLFVLQKTVLSAPISFLICILLQYLFLKKSSNE